MGTTTLENSPTKEGSHSTKVQQQPVFPFNQPEAMNCTVFSEQKTQC